MKLAKLFLFLALAGGLSAQVISRGSFVSGGSVSAGGLPSQTGNAGKYLTTDGTVTSWDSPAGAGTVTSVSFTGGLISVATPTSTAALTVAGTSGGIPYFSSASTWASSGALLANKIVIGGGAGAAPSTATTGANVLTALGIDVGSAGAFVVLNGAGGTPSSLTGTNISGTAASLTAGNATKWTTGRTVSITGDLAYTSGSLDGSGNVTGAGTLATVNSNVGSFGSATQSLTATVNAKGLVTAMSAQTVTPAVGSITGLGANVATALANATNAAGGFTPIDGTATLTNKRVTARVTTITSNATPTVNTDNCDVVSITAQAADITSMSTNLSGSPQPFDQLEYAITGTAARAITWNSSGSNFTAGPVALPTTTVTTKTLHVYYERNAANTTWLCMSSSSDL